MSILFGKGKSSLPNVPLEQPFKTDFSLLSAGRFQLDPTARGLQEESLAGIRRVIGGAPLAAVRGVTSGVRSGLSSLREGIRGNRGAFIQARVDPFQSALERRIGTAERGQERRSIRGSSFGEQVLGDIRFGGEREIANQRSQALQESLGLERALTLDELQTLPPELQAQQFEANLAGAIGDIGAQRFTQELQGLGLSSQTVLALLGLQQGKAAADDAAFNARSGNIRSFVANVAAGAGGGGGVGTGATGLPQSATLDQTRGGRFGLGLG